VTCAGSSSPAKAVTGTLTTPAKLKPELWFRVWHAPVESGNELAIVPLVVAPTK
jgi:hypothetical protein